MDQQRQQALMDNALKRVSNSDSYISTNRVMFNRHVFVEVEVALTEENLRLIQESLDTAAFADVKIEPELSGCEKLGNLIFLVLAKNFPESCIRVKIVYNDHIDVIINFNNLERK